MPKFYTYDTAAQLLGVCEKTVYTWVRRGQLKAFRVGRTVRISAMAIREFVDQNQLSIKVNPAGDLQTKTESN